jgi:hypothetical protein
MESTTSPNWIGVEGCGRRAPLESAGGGQIAARPSWWVGLGCREGEEASGAGRLPKETTSEPRREDTRRLFLLEEIWVGFGRTMLWGERRREVLHLHASNRVFICRVGSGARVSVDAAGIRRGRSRWWPPWPCGRGYAVFCSSGGVSMRPGPGATGQPRPAGDMDQDRLVDKNIFSFSEN